MKQRIIRCGQLLFKYRNAVFPLGMVLVLAGLAPRLSLGSTELDGWFDAIGVLVMVAGLALRGLVIGLQYIKRGGQDKQVYADELVTGGIFSASRNPLYVGNFLVILGLLIISGNPWGLFIGVTLVLFVYHAIVAAEEDYLLDKFGDEYRDYCASVNRWMLSPARVASALAKSRFNWSRVVIKDYNTVYFWLSATLAMLACEHIAIPAYDQDWADQVPLGMAFIGLTLIYVTVRILKKKRLLSEHGWQARAGT